MRRLRIICGVVLLSACLAGGAVAARRPSPVAPPPVACPEPDTLAARTRAMARRVETMLGAPFVRPVTAVCLPVDSARARLRGIAAKELAKAGPAGRLAVFRQLGLSPETSPDSVTVPPAWHEAGRDSVWIVAAGDLTGTGLDALLLHELVHAWHDQAYDLRRFWTGPGDSATWDCEQARRCLVEGQADWFMLKYLDSIGNLAWTGIDFRNLPWVLEYGSLREWAEAQARRERAVRPRDDGRSPKRGAISMLGWLQLYWYRLGTVFVDRAVAAGGPPRLASLMRDPPVSMQQILQPERVLEAGGRLPRAFRPGPADSLWPGATELDRDTYGPLLLRLYLETHGQGELAGFLTKGWDGDRLVLLRRGGEPPVLLWWTTWEAPWDAAGFAEGYRATLRPRGVGKSLGPGLWRGSAPDRRWSVWRDSCRVLILEDAPAADYPALRAAMMRVTAQAAAPDSGR